MALLDRIKCFKRATKLHNSFNYEATKMVFNEEVGYLILSESLTNTVARNKTVVQKIIADIKNGSEEYKLHFSEDCEVVNENGEDILSKVVVSTKKPFYVSMNKQILSIDETFDVLAELIQLEPDLDMQAVLNILFNCYVKTPLIPLFWKACRDWHIIKKPLYEGWPAYKTIVELAVIQLNVSDNSNFQYILLYIQRNTNLILLRPLKSSMYEEIAYELLNIFCDFGLPHFFDCTNKTTFLKRVLEALHLLELPFDVPALSSAFYGRKMSILLDKTKKMLNEWMMKSNSLNWGIGVHIVQWIMNSNEVYETFITSRFSQGPQNSPYHVMFGQLPHTNLIELSIQNDNSPPEPSKKDISLCSQCNQPVYKKYVCHYCLDVFHITCCERLLREGNDLPILINKCFSCVPDSQEIEDKETMQDNPEQPSSDRQDVIESGSCLLSEGKSWVLESDVQDAAGDVA